MAGAVATWSQTAANNATADSTVNWREGQAASTVNNSARAMMASTAKWRDDNSGNIVTGGSSTAYTITTSQSLTPLTDGFTVWARLHTANGSAPTLNVDSSGARAIRVSTGAAIASGAASGGSVHKFTYDSSDDCWYIGSFYVATSLVLSGLDITGATAVTTPAGDDEAPIYDTSATANRKITLANFMKVITNLTAEASPATDDEVPLYDSSANTADKITLQNLFKVINGFSEVSTPNRNADFLSAHDASANAARKIMVKNVGMVVQRAHQQATSFSTTTLIPADTTVPQITEGGQIVSATISVTSSTHRVRVRCWAQLETTHSGSSTLCLALFDGSSSAVAVSSFPSADNGFSFPMFIEYETTGLSGAVTFSARGGGNGTGTTQLWGGHGSSTPVRAAIVVEEIVP